MLSRIDLVFFMNLCSWLELSNTCLFIPNKKASQNEARKYCEEVEGQLMTADHLTMNARLTNETASVVMKYRVNLWIDRRTDVNGRCTAFVYMEGEATLSEVLDCNELYNPACVLDDSNSVLCHINNKGEGDKSNNQQHNSMADELKPKVIASVCGGVAGLLVVVLLIAYILQKHRKKTKESLKVTSSCELKRYRVSDGFNDPVITDDELRRHKSGDELNITISNSQPSKSVKQTSV